jgi:hypothetical protein
MCDDGKCGVGLPAQIGRPPKKKAAIGHGYSEGKNFANGEEMLKNTFWAASKKGAGTTVGYVIASAVEENVETLRDNVGLAAAVQVGTGMAIKKMMPLDWADSFPDHIANGMITKGGVNVFRALAKGFADKWGIKGMPNLGVLRSFKPQMQYKRAA